MVIISFIILIPIVYSAKEDYNPDLDLSDPDFNYNDIPDNQLKEAMKHDDFNPNRMPDDKLNQHFNDLPADKRLKLNAPKLAKVDPSKLGDLGQYNPDAVKQALRQKYPNANVDPADGMSVSDDGVLSYDGSTVDMNSLGSLHNIRVEGVKNLKFKDGFVTADEAKKVVH